MENEKKQSTLDIANMDYKININYDDEYEMP